jgi:glutathione S-transferase
MPLHFYMTPGSCSTGIHILLEALDLSFQVTIVNLLAGDNRKPEYLAINPRGSVPALVLEDGTALTSFQAIAGWLAHTYPKAKLLPEGAAGEASTSLVDHVVREIHGQGYTRIFTTENYVPRGLPQDEHARRCTAVRVEGRAMVADHLAALSENLSDDGVLLGHPFGIADAALFYVEFWATKTDLPLPPRLHAHYLRMRARPFVHRVLREEGYR